MNMNKHVKALPESARAELEEVWSKRVEYGIETVERDAFEFIFCVSYHVGVIYGLDQAERTMKTLTLARANA